MYPILFQYGPVEVRFYGVMIALAFIIGAWLGAREARRRGYDGALIYDLLFYVLLAAIAGARLYYVIFSDLAWFLRHPWEVLALWKGGLSLHGGLLGGFLAGVGFCLRKGLPVLTFADILAPSIILGQAIGRVGCSLNGCSYGRPTDVPWAIVFTDPNTLAPRGIPLHPTQLYELGLDLVLFGILWGIRRHTAFEGQLFAIYLMGYGTIRFGLEFFRGDSLDLIWGIPVAQAISAVFFMAGLILYGVGSRRAVSQPAPAWRGR